ncbi:hypothetical protein TRAPUB_10483 [Trametes pubescens]|uniref:Uncharacterized protein n=1 Tax=Trametes pubescens TaxID=154538 RepID=A0A1M2VZA8_TRAPU|nr:hypothetical protein TRAPUB_10483 [Trametes pubescens]
MPAFSRAVFLGLQAAALVSLVGQPFAPSAALAAPLPLPMPLMPHLADYAAQPPARTDATMVHHSENTALAGQDDAAVVPHTTSPVLPRDGDINTSILNNVNILNNWFNTMQGHSTNLRQLASQASTQRDNADFRTEVVSEVTSYQDGLLGFQNVLAQLGADKGLENYDRANELETLLKDLVNLSKDTLSYIDQLVYQIPVLGPLLGPVVYQIKCILDDVLNAVENLTDAILNAVQPLLVALIGQVTAAACGLGIQLGSLCLLV